MEEIPKPITKGKIAKCLTITGRLCLQYSVRQMVNGFKAC